MSVEHPPAAPPAAASTKSGAGSRERLTRLYDAVAQRPWEFDFFALLRAIDAASGGQPRLGRAARPQAEAIRLGQDPELDFAPAAVMSLRSQERRPPRVGVRFFGLFGPMGPLPLHLTEHARDRLRNHGDATLARFADVFHHRALLLFYRAWAQAQPAVQADRVADDRFAAWVGALHGMGPAAFCGVGPVPDAARRFVGGHLARPTRDAESIAKVLRQYFGVPVRVQSHVGHWLALRDDERSQLGRPGLRRGSALGVSAVAGAKVWDRQYKLRLQIGPLSLSQYRQFLPGQRALDELRDWMRQLVGFELLWDVELQLRRGEVPPLQLGTKDGSGAPLGWTSWLGRRGPHGERGELRLQPTQPRRQPTAPAINEGGHHG